MIKEPTFTFLHPQLTEDDCYSLCGFKYMIDFNKLVPGIGFWAKEDDKDGKKILLISNVSVEMPKLRNKPDWATDIVWYKVY